MGNPADAEGGASRGDCTENPGGAVRVVPGQRHAREPRERAEDDPLRADLAGGSHALVEEANGHSGIAEGGRGVATLAKGHREAEGVAGGAVAGDGVVEQGGGTGRVADPEALVAEFPDPKSRPGMSASTNNGAACS